MISDKIVSPLRQLPVMVQITKGAGVTKEQAAKAGGFASDEVVVIEIHKPVPGQHVQTPHSYSGVSGKELSSAELFRAWALWATDFAAREDLPQELRSLAAFVNAGVSGPFNSILVRQLEK